MRKIIAIGESVLDTVFNAGQPVRAMVGGRIACATALLASRGWPCSMVSECCTDRVGDLIVDFLERNHVDVRSVDRFTDGATALSAIFQDDDSAARRIVNYGRYPKGDSMWCGPESTRTMCSFSARSMPSTCRNVNDSLNW